MVKPSGCPLKPKAACSKRLVQKRRAKTAPSTSSSSGRLTGEEMQEMRRLAQILPSGMRASNPQNDPLHLIQNAAQYINQLTATLVARVQNGSIPEEVLTNLPTTVIDAAQRRRTTTRRIPKPVHLSSNLRRT